MNTKSLFEKLSRSTRARSLNPKALALLDVLIGMALFALIAIIAVIALGQFRQQAYLTGATEDARSIGLAIESDATANGGVYPATTAVTVTGVGGEVQLNTVKIFKLTKGNTARYETVTGGFTVCVMHKDGTATDAFSVYNSVDGGITTQKKGAPDATADPACA